MTLLDFANRVRIMRELQKDYYRNRSPDRLQTAKKAEARIDELITAISAQAETEVARPRTGADMVAWLTTRPDARSARRRAFALGRSWKLPTNVSDWSEDVVAAVYNEMVLKPIGPFVGGRKV